MEFLKSLFGDDSLTYDQLASKITENKLKVVNIADGSYVSRAKFDDNVNALNQQVTDLQGQLSQRDTDITGLNDKLLAAKADTSKLAELQAALTGLQSKYDQDKKDWDAKTKKMQYEFLVREKANTLKFTSEAAKRDFISQANGKKFQVDGDTMLGYEDFVTKYKADNPGAMAEEKTEPQPAPNQTPRIVAPSNPGSVSHGKSLTELMKAKNENPGMVISFDK